MTPQVAKDIISYCTRCKMDLVHTIVAVDGERIKRVLCRTCKNEHAYRLPAELRDTPRKSPAAKGPAPNKTKPAAYDWEAEMEHAGALQSKPYSMVGHFQTGEVVDHTAFGKGIVKRVFSSDKMEVLFRGGVKVLIRGTSGAMSKIV